HPVPSELLPLHRAERGARHQLRGVRRHGLQHVQGVGLDRGARQRDGASRGVRGGRLRRRAVHGLRVRRRDRAARPAEVGDRGHPPLLRKRPPLPGAVSPVKLPYAWLTELVKVPAGVEDVAAALALRGFEVASIDDGVIDFEITANRPDCLSVIGLAREAAAAFARPLAVPDRTTPSRGDAPGHALDVTIEDAELCPRYCAQMFELGPGAATPGWLRERLEASGVRSISPVVDVTNYVMLEMGQPTHAFDYAT